MPNAPLVAGWLTVPCRVSAGIVPLYNLVDGNDTLFINHYPVDSIHPSDDSLKRSRPHNLGAQRGGEKTIKTNTTQGFHFGFVDLFIWLPPPRRIFGAAALSASCYQPLDPFGWMAPRTVGAEGRRHRRVRRRRRYRPAAITRGEGVDQREPPPKHFCSDGHEICFGDCTKTKPRRPNRTSDCWMLTKKRLVIETRLYRFRSLRSHFFLFVRCQRSLPDSSDTQTPNNGNLSSGRSPVPRQLLLDWSQLNQRHSSAD